MFSRLRVSSSDRNTAVGIPRRVAGRILLDLWPILDVVGAGDMKVSFGFGPFELIPERSILLRDGEPVHLGSRALSLLTILVENAGKIISGSDLTTQIWPDTNVGESNLRVHLAALRKILSEAGYP